MDKAKYVEEWKDILAFPSKKVIGKTLEATTQLCIEIIEIEHQYITSRHWENILLPLQSIEINLSLRLNIFLGCLCVQFFVHVPSNFIVVRCIQRESHSHGSYQYFICEVGTPELILTNNSRTWTGNKWEETSWSIITKHQNKSIQPKP